MCGRLVRFRAWVKYIGKNPLDQDQIFTYSPLYLPKISTYLQHLNICSAAWKLFNTLFAVFNVIM